MKTFFVILIMLLCTDDIFAQIINGTHDDRRKKIHALGLITTNPNVHDPVMSRQDSTYFVYYTGPNIGVYSSTDLFHWKIMPSAFRTPKKWAVDSIRGYWGHTWAPDIIKKDSIYHLYYSCSTFGKNTSAIGHAWSKTLFTNDSVETWHDTGAVICSREGRDNFNAIDPCVVIDDKGVSWMTFGSFWGGIQLVKLKPDMCSVDDTSQQLVIARRNIGKAIEAPFLFKHDKYWYLFVSWDYCCRGDKSNYKVVVGRSKTIEGPYLDKDGIRMDEGGGSIFFIGNEQFVAAGHCAAYTFDNRDVFICHGYTADNDSRLFISELDWDNDWPIMKQ